MSEEWSDLRSFIEKEREELLGSSFLPPQTTTATELPEANVEARKPDIPQKEAFFQSMEEEEGVIKPPESRGARKNDQTKFWSLLSEAMDPLPEDLHLLFPPPNLEERPNSMVEEDEEDGELAALVAEANNCHQACDLLSVQIEHLLNEAFWNQYRAVKTLQSL